MRDSEVWLGQPSLVRPRGGRVTTQIGHCEPAKQVWQSPSGYGGFNKFYDVTLGDCRALRARNDEVRVVTQPPWRLRVSADAPATAPDAQPLRYTRVWKGWRADARRIPGLG